MTTARLAVQTESSVLGRLARRLSRDREIRLAWEFIRRCRGVILKDLVVHEMDDHRRMRVKDQTVWNFGSDSYLGLDRHPKVRAALVEAAETWGLHNGASRMFTSVELCERAERRLADWLGAKETLIFPSVTLANVGAIPALVMRGDLLIADRMAHATIHEGVNLALARGARVRELRPCRPDALEDILDSEKYDGALLLVDGVYSMTGTIPPLREMADVMRRHGGVCYIDDAHGTGVVGPAGRGAAYEALGSVRDVMVVGSLSKAFSCMGAFVTCTRRLKRLLKMRSTPYIFGGPVPPPYLAAILAVCDILQSDEHAEMLARIREIRTHLQDGLAEAGFATNSGVSPIVSVPIGDIERVFWAGKWLFDRGFYVQSVTYPAVPFNRGLLRIQVNANHTDEAVEGLLGAFAGLKDALARDYK